MAMKSVLTAGLVLLAFSLSHGQRESLSLNGRWGFAIDSAGVGMRDGWFRSGIPKAFRRMVTVPHTWNVDPGAEEYGGVAWYERRIDVPDAWSGRAIRLHFGAVYHTAQVWINGALVGEHSGSGYTPFSIECTGRLTAGTGNTIVVRVDNAFTRAAIPFFRSFDWPKDGGIIRSVSLQATQRPAVRSIRVDASPQQGEAPGRFSGSLRLSVRMMDASEIDPSHIRCVARVYGVSPAEHAGKLVAEFQPAVSGGIASGNVSLDGVRIWRCDDPALYSLSVTLAVDGHRTDSMATTFGFRDVRTRGTQLLMNHEPVRLMGVEWMPGSNPRYGMAEPSAEAAAMLERMRSVNAVFTRFHWQQAEEVLDWCDRHGIVVQEEVPLWGFGVPLNDTVMALARSQLGEMIDAHYNHPSIAMWGVGNELASTRGSIIDSLKALRAHARSLDPGRLVNYVSNRLSLGEGFDASGVGDIVMWNAYQDTWYLNDPADLRKALDTIHAAYPDKPMMITEYGLCEPANQGGDERRVRDLLYHTAVFENTPYIAGAIYFSLNDYRTHWGEEGSGTRKRRVHGVFDLDGVAKPSASILAGLSSPVEILNVGWKTAHRFEVVVIASSGLPSHPLRGYALYWSAPGEDPRTRGIRVELPDLLPGQKIQVPLDEGPGPIVDVTVVRPTGEIVARRTFEVRN
jgi:beta-galactosidase